MFLTPGYRSTNYRINENSDNLLQAKKGGGLAPARKPLGDKAVNEISSPKTVEKAKKGKELHPVESKAAVSPEISPKFSDDDLWADICSYKDIEDDMEDILPYTERLGVSGIIDILKSYVGRCSTPTFEEVYVETPGLCFDRFEQFLDHDNISVHEASIGDVSLPSLDFDSLSF